MDGWGGGVKCSRGGVEPSLSLVAASLSVVLPSLKQLPFHLDKLITESLRPPPPLSSTATALGSKQDCKMSEERNNFRPRKEHAG